VTRMRRTATIPRSSPPLYARGDDTHRSHELNSRGAVFPPILVEALACFLSRRRRGSVLSRSVTRALCLKTLRHTAPTAFLSRHSLSLRLYRECGESPPSGRRRCQGYSRRMSILYCRSKRVEFQQSFKKSLSFSSESDQFQ
jgi:hypothetical protein